MNAYQVAVRIANVSARVTPTVVLTGNASISYSIPMNVSSSVFQLDLCASETLNVLQTSAKAAVVFARATPIVTVTGNASIGYSTLIFVPSLTSLSALNASKTPSASPINVRETVAYAKATPIVTVIGSASIGYSALIFASSSTFQLAQSASEILNVLRTSVRETFVSAVVIAIVLRIKNASNVFSIPTIVRSLLSPLEPHAERIPNVRQTTATGRNVLARQIVIALATRSVNVA